MGYDRKCPKPKAMFSILSALKIDCILIVSSRRNDSQVEKMENEFMRAATVQLAHSQLFDSPFVSGDSFKGTSFVLIC